MAYPACSRQRASVTRCCRCVTQNHLPKYLADLSEIISAPLPLAGDMDLQCQSLPHSVGLTGLERGHVLHIQQDGRIIECWGRWAWAGTPHTRTPPLWPCSLTGEGQLRWHAGLLGPMQTKQKEPLMTRASAGVVAAAVTAVVNYNTQSTDEKCNPWKNMLNS